MADPNLLAANTAYGTTTYLTPSGTTAVVLLQNATANNSVYKINQIVAANTTATAASATVSVYTNGAVAQGSAPAGGAAYPVVSAVSVPANASLIAVDKTTAIYLQGGTSISVTSGTASAITYTISYEVIT